MFESKPARTGCHIERDSHAIHRPRWHDDFREPLCDSNRGLRHETYGTLPQVSGVSL